MVFIAFLLVAFGCSDSGSSGDPLDEQGGGDVDETTTDSNTPGTELDDDSETITDAVTDSGSEEDKDTETDPDTGSPKPQPVCGNGVKEKGEKCDADVDCGDIPAKFYIPGTVAPCSDDCKTLDDSACEVMPGFDYGTMTAHFEYRYIYLREGDSRYGAGFMGNGRNYDTEYDTYADYMAAFPQGMNEGELAATSPFFSATFGDSEVLPGADAHAFRSYATFIDTDTVDHANALGEFERHVDVWQFLLDASGNIIREKAVLFEISTYAQFGPQYRRFGVSKDRDLNGHRLFIVDLDDSESIDADAIRCVHAFVELGATANYKNINNITDDITGRIIGVDAGYTFKLQHPSIFDDWPEDFPACSPID